MNVRPVGEDPEYEGYIRDLLDELSTVTKIQYDIMINSDNHPGRKDKGGTWGGVVGDVTSGKAQMGAGPITETAQRREDVDFSTPFMSFGPVVILKRPRKQVMTLQERFRRLFMPLSDSVWLMSGLAWLVTSAVLYIISYVNPYDWRKLMKDKQATLREGESFTCLNTFWFTMSTLMWQGYTRAPRSLGARIVVTLWWKYVLCFIIMYIASMTNFLRLGPTPKETQSYSYIQRVEDLARQTQLDYGVLANGSTQQMLRRMKPSVPLCVVNPSLLCHFAPSTLAFCIICAINSSFLCHFAPPTLAFCVTLRHDS
ncbi:glutamate receptor, ionotropic kainate 3 [Elysia marginata]|uniref:Glutamate receptor, ionotropic kainate 3 n=1 Tax=Elysia marginata TaxID=1093978 RepID=A0AAV4JBB7_9GAST|nr:glutamate receptor, ionotropic kainate 3 [Elysia marginata]